MRFRSFTAAPLLIAVGLFVASCGATSDTDRADAGVDTDAGTGTDVEAPIEDLVPTSDGLAAPAATNAPAGSGTPVPTELAAVPPSAASASTAPASTAPASTESAVQPVVAPAALGGRTFAADLAPGSDIASNFLPDLVVDDVGRDAKANLRNVFPAERPVLIWMWAPH